MNFTIAEASEALLPQIQRIEQQSFSVPWTEAMLRMQLDPDSHVFLTAETPEGVVGYVGMLYVLDEGYISNVAVAPAARRRGIGRALVKEMLCRAETRELSFVTLEVREHNEAAIALYAGEGFLPVGRRRGYYEKPREDAILMTYLFIEDEDT